MMTDPLSDAKCEPATVERALESRRQERVPDEASLFTVDEFVRAFERIAAPHQSRRLARETAQPKDPGDYGPQWQLSPDVLDLLSLVSDDCAERVRQILGLSPDAARERRASAAARFSKL